MKFILAVGLVISLLSVAEAYIDPGTGVTFVSGIGAFLWGILALVIGTVGVTFKRWWSFVRTLLPSKKR